MSLISWRLWARSLYVLQICIPLMASQMTSTIPTIRPIADYLCQLVYSDRSTCRDLEGRDVMYSYPSNLIGASDGFIEVLLFLARREQATEQCIDLSIHIACLFSERPCNPQNNLPILVCEESCRIYQRITAAGLCQDLIDHFSEIVTSTDNNMFQAIYSLVLNFDCTDPSTYFFENITEADPNNCTNLFSLESESLFLAELNEEVEATTTMSTDPAQSTDPSTTAQLRAHSFQVLILSILVPVLCVIFAILVIICACCCYMKQRKKNLDSTEPEHKINHELVLPNSPLERSFDFPDSVKQKYMKVFSKVLIPYEAIQVGDKIGQGAFGLVFRGYYGNQEQKEIALKTLKNMTSESEVEAFFSESIIMKDFHHPNVLGLLGVVFDTPDGVPYLVLPFMKNGNLKDYLKPRRVEASDIDTLPQDLKLSDITKLCTDIAQGMAYLADKKFIHRDLAARNCMLSEDMVVKVGDFGLARDVYITDYYRASSKHARLPVKWMAPESFNDNISTEKTDVWSFGVTCWEVYSLGRTPYPTVPNSDIFSYISRGRRLEKPSLCPNKMFTALETCWEHRPEDRPSFAELVETLVEYRQQEYEYI